MSPDGDSEIDERAGNGHGAGLDRQEDGMGSRRYDSNS